jgi:hypothetical protein
MLIVLPNFIWQLTHHMPVFTHMKALRQQQLDYITSGQFYKTATGGKWHCLVCMA